jgi:hypothetical protein
VLRVACSEWVHCADTCTKGSSNSLIAIKSCACASIAFQAGIISWSMDSINGNVPTWSYFHTLFSFLAQLPSFSFFCVSSQCALFMRFIVITTIILIKLELLIYERRPTFFPAPLPLKPSGLQHSQVLYVRNRADIYVQIRQLNLLGQCYTINRNYALFIAAIWYSRPAYVRCGLRLN